MKVGRAERRAPSRPTMDPRTCSHSPRPLSLCCCEGLGQRQGQGLAGLRAHPPQVCLPPILALADPADKHPLSPAKCPAGVGLHPGDGRHESTSYAGLNSSWGSPMPSVPTLPRSGHPGSAGADEDPACPPAGTVHAPGAGLCLPLLAHLPQHGRAGPGGRAPEPGPAHRTLELTEGRQRSLARVSSGPAPAGMLGVFTPTPPSRFPMERPGAPDTPASVLAPGKPSLCTSCSRSGLLHPTPPSNHFPFSTFPPFRDTASVCPVY